MIPNDEKYQIYSRVTSLFLQANNPSRAEYFLSKSSDFLKDIQSPQLFIQYDVNYATKLQKTAEFVKAANKFYEISLKHPDVILSPVPSSDIFPQEKERPRIFEQAIRNVIAAEVSAQKSRVVAWLAKDDRSRSMTPLHEVLNKLFLNRLITKKDRETIVGQFEPEFFQKPKGDESSFLDCALIEHNISALSQLYENMTVGNLAAALNTSEANCEKYVSRMTTQGRLKATIDQRSNLINFLDGNNSHDQTLNIYRK